MTSSDILDWSEEVPLDEGIEEYEYRRYPPNAGGVAMLNQPGQIRFSIESGDIFVHPHRSYIQFEGRVTKADGTTYDNADMVTIANNGLMYLFNQVRYEMGGREIETLLFPGHATTMLGLLEYTEDFSRSRGLAQGWAKDEKEYSDIGGVVALSGAGNKGFKRRQQYLLSSYQDEAEKGYFTVNIPLSHIFGFCKDYDKIIYGIKHELFLTRKDDDQPIYRAAAADVGKLTLNNMYWFVPIIKPSISNLNSLMTDMSKNINIKIDFDRRQVFSVDLPLNNTSYTWNLTTKAANEKPRFVIVGFQEGRREAQTDNPSTFNHTNIRELHIFLNNVKRYPALDFTMDFNKNNYTDAYNAAMEYRCLVSGLPSCVSNFSINPIDFKHLYPLFVFDISKQSATLKTAITNITVEMTFHTGVPANTTAYAVVLSDNTLLFKSDGKEIRPEY